jgi:hypothetical protein
MFYVYLYLREDGTPYYVGKGKGHRSTHLSHNCEVPPVERIKYVLHTDDETEAFTLERKLIAQFGSKVKGGLLENRRLGGGEAGGNEGAKLATSKRCVYEGVEYASYSDAARAVGVSRQTIANRVAGMPSRAEYLANPGFHGNQFVEARK